MAKTFEYTFTHKFTEGEYIDIITSYSFISRLLPAAIMYIVGIVCLLWSYTLILGLIILISMTIKIFLPKLVQRGLKNDFKRRKVLQQSISYSITDSALQLSSEGITYKASWYHLVSWKEKDGWLILKPSGIDALYFKITNLKEAGIYNFAIELAKKHAATHN